MSPETPKNLPEGDADGLNLKETELTLGIPGGTRVRKAGVKRPFLDTMDLKLNSGATTSVVGCSGKKCKDDQSDNEIASITSPPASKAQVVGWPPVRALRKNMMKSCKYVKVAVDGAPYLRKIDLGMYSSYQQLLSAFEELFTCLTIRNVLNERKLVDPVNRLEYVATYEDKDGDWMLVGDVPWNMFVESCKRLRLMKSSEAIGLAPRTPTKCSSSSC